MRIAVTGASGFVGRHVVEALLAKGADVIAVSRHPDAPASAAVTPVAMDIAHAGDAPLARMGNPDALVHLAWGGLPNYRSHLHLDEELARHIHFLDRCLEAGLDRLVVAGTCLEYGLQPGELDEAMAAAPTTAYAQAKHALHLHLQQQRARLGFGLGWLRLFYVHGQGQSPQSLFPQLQAAVAAGATDFDMSVGDQVRDFLPIGQAAAHIAALAIAHRDPGVVNVCSGKPVTVADAVQGWLGDWGATLRLNRGARPLPDYEPFAFWGSTRRLDSLLEKT